MKNLCGHGQNRSMAFGLLIITVGTGLLLRSLNIFSPEVERILFHWPVILLLAGIYHLLCPGHRHTGFILLAIGTIFTLPRISGFPLDFHQIFWPSILIIIGLVTIFKHGKKKPSPFHNFEEVSLDENFIIDSNVFGGSQKIITSKQLKGGRFTSIFGGSEINLTQAELGPEPVVFDVLFVFGGSTIIIPANWTVHLEATNIFGGFSQKQIRPINEDPTKQIFIKGVVVFGGGEIKRY